MELVEEIVKYKTATVLAMLECAETEPGRHCIPT